MTSGVDQITATTFHRRRGDTQNAFSYSVEYVLLDAEDNAPGPLLFGRNRRNVAALNDRDHGGAPGAGTGPRWVRSVLHDHGIELPGRIDLLAQPRVLGHVFNPVSFWLCHDKAGVLRAVIAEVTNTFGERHSYLCCDEDLRPISPDRPLAAQKVFHVSPFQDVAGDYLFSFDIRPDRIAIRIDLRAGDNGLVATLTGQRRPLTNIGILSALVRRPFGSRRVLALIHWQALRLWRKGVVYRFRPEPPRTEVSGQLPAQTPR